MLNRRQSKRFKEHCDVEFVSDGKMFTGTSGDFALDGLFIMTRDAKAPGTILDIAIHLPNGATSRIRGKVRRFIKTVVGRIIWRPDGMGIEIIEKDDNYLHFIRSLLVASEGDSPCHAPEMDAELIQEQHKEPMPEKRAGKYEGRQRDLHNEPRPLSGREKELERHRVLLGPENQRKSRKSFDEMLLEHISGRLKA